ncbi:MAG: hypothetical protein ACYC8T_27960 [Myxococcaceae bacterium]
MNRIAAAAALLVSSFALAQEIGKEISSDQAATPPPASAPASYDNPYAPPPAPPTAPAEVKPEAQAPAAVPGPRKGAFGLRAGVGGATAGIGAPTIGFTFLATDSVGITFDFGGGLRDTGDMGFGLGLGIDVRLGSASKPIRPLFIIGAGFGKAISTRGDDMLLDFNIGGGAEYWFSDHFSFNGKALVDLPIDLRSGRLSVVTLTPGIGGTFYF